MGKHSEILCDPNSYMCPTTSTRRSEGLEFSIKAAEIFSNPNSLIITIRHAKEHNKYLFCIAREDMHTPLHDILRTNYKYDSYESAQKDLEYTLRLIVRLFSDEHENPNSKMITTKHVDWIMSEVSQHRTAITCFVAKPVFLTE